ncbi:MAG: glycosyltransferase [Alkalibacterium sp.]|nr:glycosyltransferase [Alkalibacterium sp.]
MIMNIYRSIDREKVQFDFVVDDSNKKYDYEEEIEYLGGNIYRIPKYKAINYFSYRNKWKSMLMSHMEWNIIHIHHTVPAFAYLGIAKKNKLVTIVHSHTAGSTKSIKSMLKIISRYPLRFHSDYLFACSVAAAKWMFGNKSSKAIIINNSIDSKRYIFSAEKRELMRAELNLENSFTIGHIGNFSKAKNYPFILDVFNEVYKQNQFAKLLLIGKNANNPEVERRVKELNLEKNVILTGVRSDIPDMLQAIDVFLFPSLHEGLPVTLIEAQASGLKILASDTITNEVAITDNVEFMSLNKSAKAWADRIMKYSGGYERKDTSQEILSTGYDIQQSTKWLESFYLAQLKNCEDI